MESAKKYRNAIFYKDYFEKFFLKQNDRIKEKIIWTIQLIEELERVPEQYLKHIESTKSLYEIRVKHGNDIFRIFCFLEDNKLIIIMNGFSKKTKKTPKNEINKALKIKKEYESEN